MALRQTGKAVLCVIRGREIWIPQSQITDDSEVWQAGQTGTLVVTRWLAEQKRLVLPTRHVRITRPARKPPHRP